MREQISRIYWFESWPKIKEEFWTDELVQNSSLLFKVIGIYGGYPHHPHPKLQVKMTAKRMVAIRYLSSKAILCPPF